MNNDKNDTAFTDPIYKFTQKSRIYFFWVKI